jgi:PLP dependent protein
MNNPLDYLADNLSEVMERIAASAKISGRRAQDVTLVAVSKTFGADLIGEAYRLGARNFGENYVQEAIAKIDSLGIDVKWHFLGHLQKNKVRPVALRFDVIQSVDSPELLTRIERLAEDENRNIEALLQVNLAGEDDKFGMPPELVAPTLVEASGFKRVKMVGLMLLPPFYYDPEKNRANFSALRELSEKIDKAGFPNWEGKYLSMGMTDDFETAISEGSNMVRVGRAIFGERRARRRK